MSSKAPPGKDPRKRTQVAAEQEYGKPIRISINLKMEGRRKERMEK
jgi:hypothetical protein